MNPTMTLSKRDKQAIQTVTRYADVMREIPFEFTVHYWRVRFGKGGTTSHAQFDPHSDDLKVMEQYVATLAVFAFQRLARKYGSSCFSMIRRDVYIIRSDLKPSYSANLGELVIEHFDKPLRQFIEEAK